MIEYFQTYDESGALRQLVPRHRVHREGLWHRAAHVFLLRSDGQLLIQQRSSTKDVCPHAWDLSVAEHLKPGESYIDAAHRGLKEELSLTGVELMTLGTEVKARLEMPTNHLQGAQSGAVPLENPWLKDYEFQQNFIGVSDDAIMPDPVEVADCQFVRLDELAEKMNSNRELFTPWFKQCRNTHQARLLSLARLHCQAFPA